MRRRRFLPTVLAAGLVIASSPASAREIPEAATAPVRALVDALRSVTRADADLDFAARRERLAPVIRESFDLRFMARLAVGRHWRELSPDQRDRLADTFARLSVTTFAGRFDGGGELTFSLTDPRPGPRESVFVPTRIVRPNAEDVEIAYLVRNEDGGWRAVDIYLDGTYSELASRRSEFSSILSNEGFDALIARIETRIQEARNGG